MTTTAKPMIEPGIYRGMPWGDYLAIDAMNPSTLKHGLKSMLHLRRSMDGECQPNKKTVAIGNATHCLLAGELEDRYAVMPSFHEDDLNVTASGKPSKSKVTAYAKGMAEQWREENTKDELTEVQVATASKIANLVRKHCGAMIDASEQELVVIGEIGGVPMKTRIDGLHGTEVWDLKTTADVTDIAFYRRFKQLNYGFSAAVHVELLWQNGIKVDRYKIIAAEVGDDYDVRTIYVPMVAMGNWSNTVERVAEKYRIAKETDIWPGLPDSPLLIPDWDMAEDEPEIDWSPN